MVTKSVLKVDISCDKCKQKLLKLVCGVEGVNKVEADSEKGTLTIIGEADPYEIILQIRKAGKFARFVSVGPPPKPDDKPENKPDKKPDDDKCKCSKCAGQTCSNYCWASIQCPCPGFSCSGCVVCRPVAYMTVDYQDPGPPCSIM